MFSTFPMESQAMRLCFPLRRARTVTIAMAIVARSVSAFGQSGQSPIHLNLESSIQAAVGQAATQTQETMRPLSIDEAVRLALEQNLGIQIQRIDPQISDVGISQARSFWAPQLTSSLSRQSQSQASTSALSGGIRSIDNRNFATGLGVSQNLPTGASYDVNWNNSRFTTTSFYNNFSPQVASNINAQISQPLLKNFGIDQIRQQVQVSKKLRDLSDIQLGQVITQASRSVRNAYWDLSYAIDNLKAQQESLKLAQQSLSDNRKRVEIGTLAPIDIVQAQAEVASNEERVILAEAQIKRAQDNLRILILDPAAPEFWTTTFQPTDAAPFNDLAVDTDGAVRNALDQRTDVRSAKNTIERSDVDIRFLRNQILPDVSAQATYISRGVGGTQLTPVDLQLAASTGVVPPRQIVATRSFGNVLGDIFQNAYPDWTVGLQITYPLGTNTAEANLARAKLQYQQSQTQLKNLQMQVAAQVREAGRQVQTNQKRVLSAKASRELQEKKLEAEEKKLAAGMSQSFFVFQAQRDLSFARTAEIQAIADYNKSVVDFETVQLVPLGGAGAGGAGGGTGSGTGSGNGSGGGLQPAGQGSIVNTNGNIRVQQ
jgi:outer membrane protein TolC